MNTNYSAVLTTYEHYLQSLENRAADTQSDAQSIQVELLKINNLVKELVKINEEISQSLISKKQTPIQASYPPSASLVQMQEKVEDYLKRATKLNKLYMGKADQIAERLHFSKEEFRKTILGQDIPDIQTFMVKQKYEEMFKESGIDKGKAEEVVKVIEIGLKELSKSTSPKGAGQIVTVEKGSFIKGSQVLVTSKPNFRLDYLSKHLGTGGFGVVTSTRNVVSGELSAFKEAREDLSEEVQEQARKDLLNEYEKLCEIHKNGPVPGIQDKPHALYYFEGKVQGFLGTYYDHSLTQVASSAYLSVQDRIRGTGQLLWGFNYLSQIGLHHGDIKSENILVKGQGSLYDDKTPSFHLADFGGTEFYDNLNLDQLEAEGNLMAGGFTTKYTLESDQEKIEQALKERNVEKYRELQEKRNVRAMGICLCELLRGIELSTTSSDIFLDEKRFIEDLRKQGFSEEDIVAFNDLIKKMTDPDIEKRIMPREALELYNDYVRASHEKNSG